MQLKNPDIRYLHDMKQVLYGRQWEKTAPNLELYYMYRAVKRKDGLRYDLTVIPFRLLKKEFAKTKGHRHPGEYAELYNVLEGRAVFLLQKWNANRSRIDDVYAVEAEKGDEVFIPARYGHVTINPGPDELKMGNWVTDRFQSDYSLFLEKQGACYYYTEAGWIRNEHYGKIPELRFEAPNKDIPKDLEKALMGK